MKLKLITIILLNCWAFNATSSEKEPVIKSKTILDLFYIERNKNKNLVQYTVELYSKTCLPAKKKPAGAYWRMLEKSDTARSKVRFYERAAYGFDSQIVNDGVLKIHLEALPTRQILVSFDKVDEKCTVKSTVKINDTDALLDHVYAYAKEGILWPTAKWIEIHGTSFEGDKVDEKIYVD